MINNTIKNNEITNIINDNDDISNFFNNLFTPF